MPQKSIITPILGNEYYHIFNRGNNGCRLFYNEANYGLFIKLFREFVSPYCDTLAFCLIANHFHLLIKTNATIYVAPKSLITPSNNSHLDSKGRDKGEQDFLLLNNHYQWDDINNITTRKHQVDPITRRQNIHVNRQDNPQTCHTNAPKKTNTFKGEVPSGGLFITDKVEVGRFISEQFRRAFLQYALKIKKQEEIKGSLFVKPFKRLLVEKQDYLEQVIFYIHMNPAKHDVQQAFKTYRYSSYQYILSDNQTFVARDHVLELFGGIKGFDEYHDVRWEARQALLADIDNNEDERDFFRDIIKND